MCDCEFVSICGWNDTKVYFSRNDNVTCFPSHKHTFFSMLFRFTSTTCSFRLFSSFASIVFVVRFFFSLSSSSCVFHCVFNVYTLGLCVLFRCSCQETERQWVSASTLFHPNVDYIYTTLCCLYSYLRCCCSLLN